VYENVKASGVQLEPGIVKRIDEVLDPIVERDPAKAQQLDSRP
jgi:hypothetical protein